MSSSFICLLFLSTQLFYLGAQLAYFDEQQLHFPPHHR
jgi:hypothetical protein